MRAGRHRGFRAERLRHSARHHRRWASSAEHWHRIHLPSLARAILDWHAILDCQRPCSCRLCACACVMQCSQQRPACCIGLEEEFIFVGRLDNLGMSYLSLQALIDSTSRPEALADETAVEGSGAL